jgi:hypothetical protein
VNRETEPHFEQLLREDEILWAARKTFGTFIAHIPAYYPPSCTGYAQRIWRGVSRQFADSESTVRSMQIQSPNNRPQKLHLVYQRGRQRTELFRDMRHYSSELVVNLCPVVIIFHATFQNHLTRR